MSFWGSNYNSCSIHISDCLLFERMLLSKAEQDVRVRHGANGLDNLPLLRSETETLSGELVIWKMPWST